MSAHGWGYLRPEDLDTILEGIRQGKALGGPYHAEIDPIDVCNADCFFCNSVEFRRGDVLRWDVLGPRVEELIAGGLRSFRLSGGGEPTLYPDLRQLCERMGEAGVILDNLTTNGVALSARKATLLAPLGPTYYNISLNYASRERYEQFMRIPATAFDKAAENIRQLDQTLAEAGRRRESCLNLQFFIQPSTVGDLERMMELSAELPVDQVMLSSIGDAPEGERMSPEHIESFQQGMAAIAPEWLKRRPLRLSLDHYGLREFSESLLRPARGQDAPEDASVGDPAAPDPIEFCYIGWHSLVVQGTGEVHPCCYLMPEKKIPAFGNLRQQTVAEVWQGESYSRFRQEMRWAMLVRSRTPMQSKRFRCTMPYCWSHDQCLLAYDLADRPFYERAHAELEKLRRRPALRLANIAASAARAAIDGSKKLAGVS
jgi:MoaA/NifB/PqqE/SkfB family radical SAM enzyme